MVLMQAVQWGIAWLCAGLLVVPMFWVGDGDRD